MIAALLLATMLTTQQAQTGKSPRDVLQPQTYRMLSGADRSPAAEISAISVQMERLASQYNAMAKSLAVLSQRVEDMERRAESDRTRAVNPADQIERITKLEEYVRRNIQDDADRAEESKARWETVFSWSRILFSGLLAFAINEGWKRWQLYRRHAVQEKKLDQIKDEVAVMKEHADETMARLLKMTEKAAVDK
jgi:hypothetical protein